MKVAPISALAIITIVVLFAFPKAGIYVGEVPLTFGYALLAISGAVQLARSTIGGRRRIRADFACLSVLFLLLGAVEAASFSAYGARSLGSLVSIVASTIVVPLLSLASVHLFLETLGIDKFLRLLRISLVIVFTFGMISFAAYNISGTVIGIPFLTTTGADIQLVAERHNLRGSIIKMFSTYNNGNILGVNLLIWGPVAAVGSRLCLFQFRSICIFSLSRSVWIGLAAMELVNSVARRSIRKTAYAVTFVGLLVAMYVGASWYMGRDPTAFLLDRNLGGRVANFEKDLQGIKTQEIGWSNESLYAASYLAFGSLGAVLITAIWAVPIVLGGRSRLELQSRIALAIYLFVASAEAAFNLIPTQASYWMIAGIAMGLGQPKSELRVSDNTTASPTENVTLHSASRNSRRDVSFDAARKRSA